MKGKLPAKIGLAVIVVLLLMGCNGPGDMPEPHDYTHTTELEQIEIYEFAHIEDAERSVFFTLEQLGCNDLILEGGGDVDSEPISYELPEDATQGPDTWYIFHLHCLIEFEEDCGNGYGSVGVGGIAASVHFNTIRVNDSPFIRIGGRSSDSVNIEVRYYNYMSQLDIKPGKSQLRFELEQRHDARVKSVTIYNDSGLETTAVPRSGYDAGLILTPEEEQQAYDIAFGDPRVQELAEGKEYAVRITRGDGMVQPVDEEPEDVEVRLVFAQSYMIEDVEAIALDVFVNLDEGVVTYLFPLDERGMPALTESAREKAVAIALSDAGVQAELEGRGYTVGDGVGPAMGGPAGRLGANVYFIFDEPFLVEFGEVEPMQRLQTGIRAVVNLQEEAVIDIFEETEPVDF